MSHKIVGAVLGLLGYATLCIVDWRIAAGVFVCIWADNISRQR